MTNGLKAWHRECPNCRYQKADFQVAINEKIAQQRVDEILREYGLKSLRVSNFKKLIEAIFENSPKPGRLLDVGCAHGWFLEMAQLSGFEAIGIEPDEAVFNETSKRGLQIRKGYFPQALKMEEKFDVIAFNDVFEHIPDIRTVLRACQNHLNDGGLLVINLPSSHGIFYRIARLAAALGFTGFFERLWQKDLPSPHLHYFNSANLKKLLESNGFRELSRGYLNSVRIQGLFERISIVKKYGLLTRSFIWLGITLALPFFKLMPKDIIFSISKKMSG
jgi:SAM-dependent methyltransferase